MTKRSDPAKPSAKPSPTGAGNNAKWDKDDARDASRHASVTPKDEGVLESIGQSVSEGLTGADTGATKKPPSRS